MVDLTMLAPGPAGTSMIGESNIEAAARRGLAKQRQRDQEMKFANEIPSKDVYADTEATLPAYKSPKEDKSQPQLQPQLYDANDRYKSIIQTPSKPQPEDSLNMNSGEDSSERPVRENGLRGKWERMRRRLRG